MHPAPDTPPAGPPPVRHRLLYAYSVTARVLLSYLGVELAAWLRGRKWREGALLRRHRRNARRVERAIVRLQGLFVKVGQLVSMLTTFLPAEFRGELEGLQDKVAPRPWPQVAARLREELGASPEVLFAELDPEPLASASLAQVHAGRLADGTRVAVKVQHLGIEELARRDLATIDRILRVAGFFLRVRGLSGVQRELAAMIAEELDFEREAANLATIAAGLSGDPTVRMPAVVSERSARRVLTTTFVEGIKVSHGEELDEAGIDRQGVAETVLAAYCRMIFELGVYHADPHPGNLFVVPADGGPWPRGDHPPSAGPAASGASAPSEAGPAVAIAFVDFGAVGRLSEEMREGIPELFQGILGSDARRILSALRKMGFVARHGDERAAERVISYLHRRFLEQLTLESWNLGKIRFDTRMKVEAIVDLRRLGVSLRDLTELFEVPRDWALLERTLLLLLGLCAHLAPQMNPLATVRPYLEALVLGRERDWTAVAASTLRDLAVAAFTLPGEIRRLVARAEHGELEVRVEGAREGLDRLHAALRQLLWGLFAVAGGAVWYAAHTRGQVEIAAGAGAVAGVAALLLLASILRSRRPRR
jgi:predicted unusual protein kinase regulating ubiquinone biosynthesis (AarF/ABC1/UbiB family)